MKNSSIENMNKVFEQLEGVVSKECILASNTYSLSIASIGYFLL